MSQARQLAERIKNEKRKDSFGRPRHEYQILSDLTEFFEETCPSQAIEVGDGGNYSQDEIKRIAENLWMLKKVDARYDQDIVSYSFLDSGQAEKWIASFIKKTEERIIEITTKKRQAEQALIGIKKEQAEKA